MLYHHDSRSYAHAASEAAREARDKMHRIIDGGRASAMRVFEHVNSHRPDDVIARGRVMRFGYAAPTVLVDALTEDAIGVENDEGIPVNLAAMLDGDRAPQNDAPIPSLVLQVAEQTEQRIHPHAFGQLAGRAGVPVKYLRELVGSPNPALRALGLARAHTIAA
jgi:hypothetical protein